MADLGRPALAFMLAALLLAGCGGKAKVQYPLIDGTEFQVRTFKIEKHKYNAVGSRKDRGPAGMIDPAGEVTKIMAAIQSTMAGICAPGTAVLEGSEVQPLVIAINTLYLCVDVDG